MFGKAKYKLAKVAALKEDQMINEIDQDELLNAQKVDLNRKQLYEDGQQADGSPTGEYAPITKSYYKPLAASEGRDGRSDHITGKDTGETYKSMHVVVKDDGFVISADDRNGFFSRIDKGLGLTKESLAELRPEYKEHMIEKVHKAMQ